MGMKETVTPFLNLTRRNNADSPSTYGYAGVTITRDANDHWYLMRVIDGNQFPGR